MNSLTNYKTMKNYFYEITLLYVFFININHNKSIDLIIILVFIDERKVKRL